jgi:hypothetical protein
MMYLLIKTIRNWVIKQYNDDSVDREVNFFPTSSKYRSNDRTTKI